MASTLAERRLEVARELGSGAGAFRFEPSKLRFSLGVSLAELKIPFALGPDAARILTQSARQLALMLVSRHRDLLSRDEFEGRFLLSEEFGALPEAPPTLTPQSGGPDVRAAAEMAPRAHPLLTGGVIAAWLGPGGGGRSLVALVIELLRRALSEMNATRGREPTPVLVALMLSHALPEVDRALKGLALPTAAARPLHAGAATGVFLALRLAVDRALRDTPLPPDLLARIDAPLSLFPLLGGRQATLGSGAYGCELFAGVPDLDEVLSRHADGFNVEGVQAAIERALRDRRDLSERADAAVGLGALRSRLLRCAAAGEDGLLPATLTELLRNLTLRPALLSSIVDDDKQRKGFRKDLAAQAEASGEPARHELEGLAAALKAYSLKSPGDAAGLPLPQLRAEYARAATAFAADAWMERLCAQARRVLDARTGREAEGGLDAEYHAGRLYRLSAAPEPILSSSVAPPLGHLFVDVKDFTRRTALLGQAAMAEFLRREFYLPILGAAKAHHGGFAHLADKGGVSLNNLLGDAISMSGDVEALLKLAQEIRRHLVLYERRLASSVSSETVAASVRAIEDDFAKKMAEAPSALHGRLAQDRELALARARGESLEAGVFISFGPAPLVITLEDELFGRSKVAIADRINESARGTARSPGARAAQDAFLRAERDRRGDPRLAHPWSVFVGAPFSIPVRPEAEAELRAALAQGDKRSAIFAVGDAVKDALDEAARVKEPLGDIYNAGVALSEEALLAFQEALGGRRTFRTRELEPASLHPEIQRRFAFEPQRIRLVVGYDERGQAQELFREVGRVAFKGFERKGGILVYELVNEYGVGRLLLDHHAASWR